MTPTELHKSLTCADTRVYRKCPDISVSGEYPRFFRSQVFFYDGDFSLVSRHVHEEFIVLRALAMLGNKLELTPHLFRHARANNPRGEIIRHLFHLKLNAHSSSSSGATVEPSMSLHHSPWMTATPPQDSFSNHHAVSRASIGAAMARRQVVASTELRLAVAYILRSYKLQAN
jgi:hypothetical protein